MLIWSNKHRYNHIDKFQDSTDEVLPILGCSSVFFSFGVSQFCKNLGLNFLFLLIVVHIFLWAR